MFRSLMTPLFSVFPYAAYEPDNDYRIF